MKLDYIVVYENSSKDFDIEHYQIKAKITLGLQKFSPFTTIGAVGDVHIFKHRLYISALEQARALILGKYVLLGVINTI